MVLVVMSIFTGPSSDACYQSGMLFCNDAWVSKSNAYCHFSTAYSGNEGLGAQFQCEDLGVDKHALSVASDQGSGAGPEYPHTAVACRILVQGLTKVLKDKMKHPDVGTLGKRATVFFVPQKQFARGCVFSKG